MASDDAWHSGFHKVILKPLRAIPEAAEAYTQRDWDEIHRRAKQGKVSASADLEANLWEAFLYQRSHADAAFDLFVKAKLAGMKGHLAVLDLGCGAATVAVALTEALREFGTDRRFDYYGVDHNDFATDLAVEMLDAKGVSQHHRGYLYEARRDARKDLTSRLSKASIPIVTTSYLLNQDLPSGFAQGFAITLSKLVSAAAKVDRDVLYLGVEASYNNWRPLNRVVAELNDLGVKTKFEIKDWTSHDLRYPSLYPAKEGRYRQYITKNNNLLRWMLRLHQ